LEGELMASVDSLSAQLSEGLGEHIVARRAELLGTAEETGAAMAGGFGDELGTKKLGDLGGTAALSRGSSEAFSAVLGAMRNSGGDPATETAKTTKEMLAEQKAATRELRRLAKTTPVELVPGTV